MTFDLQGFPDIDRSFSCNNRMFASIRELIFEHSGIDIWPTWHDSAGTIPSPNGYLTNDGAYVMPEFAVQLADAVDAILAHTQDNYPEIFTLEPVLTETKQRQREDFEIVRQSLIDAMPPHPTVQDRLYSRETLGLLASAHLVELEAIAPDSQRGDAVMLDYLRRFRDFCRKGGFRIF